MNATTRTAMVLLLPAVLVFGHETSPTDSVLIRPGIEVHGATPEELDLVRWAVGRYDRAGLRLPFLRFYFHGEVSGCEDRLGFYLEVRIDLCPGLLINLTTHHTILHEMGHAWSEAALTPADRARFMRLRHLETWDSWDVPWGERGWEQAADIVAWALGDRVLMPTIPDNSPDQLAAAYEQLTGSPPPH